MRGRRLTVAGLALATTLLLSGCAEAGSLVNRTGIDLGLQQLTSELEAIPSVATVTPTSTLNGDYSYSVDVRVVVDVLVEGDVVSILHAVAATFEAAPFTSTRALSFGLTASDGSAFTPYYPLDISAHELDNEIHYWIALAAAYGGPLDMGLYGYPDDYTGPEKYLRNISADDERRATDWDAVRAVPDSSTAHRSWNLSGLGFEEAWPPDAVLELRDSLAAIVIHDEGNLALTSYAIDLIGVSYFSPLLEDPAMPATAASWPEVLAAVSLIVGSGFPLADFSYTGYDTVAGFVHLGECGGEVQSAAGDDALWEALAASTIALPAGSGAGYCSNA